MKKIVALVLSLVMALSLCTVAFADDATTTNPDAKYDWEHYSDSMTNGEGKTYTYVVRDYVAGGTNYLPYLFDGTDNYFVGGKDDTVLYDGDKVAPVTLGKKIKNVADITYNYTAVTQAEQKWTCTTDGVDEGYKYTDENDKTAYAVDYKATNKGAVVYLLVDGKIVKANKTTAVAASHILIVKTGTKGTEVAVGVREAKCAACQKTYKFTEYKVNSAGALYDVSESVAAWALESKAVALPNGYSILTGTYAIIGESGATTPDKAGVDSAKTFDAGVAMYVGMSLLSVAGGAVVIGKKKEF